MSQPLAVVGWRDVSSVCSGACVKNLRVHKVPGNGNCFFHVLGHHAGCTAAKTRKKICSFMKEQGHVDLMGLSLMSWIAYASDLTPREYIGRMSKNREWGSALEIMVYALLENVDVFVCRQASGGSFRVLAKMAVCSSPDKVVI